MLTEQISAAHSILSVLEEEGVEYLFGVPGGPLTGLFEALKERDKIRLVLAKHEAGAAYMAASHARVRRSLAVCCATSGPGATNALTGIASAQADGLPVLLLTGQVSTNVFGKGAIQESSAFGVDLVSLFRPVTKMSAMLPSVERTPEILRAAIRAACSGRNGAVHLSMPADILRRPVTHTRRNPRHYRPLSRPFDALAIAEAARLLASAKHPCVLVGNGVSLSDASAELQSLVHAAQIPVFTSPKGKGAFPETDRFSLGVLGFGGHERAETYLAQGKIDVLLVVGCSMNEFVTNAWTLPIENCGSLIQIDIDPSAIGRNYPVEVGVVGDAREALRELREQLLDLPGAFSNRDNGEFHRIREVTPRYLEPATINSSQTPLKPQRLVKEMRDAMPDDALLFVDNGTAIIWAGHYFETRRPHTYFIDLGLASMGSAVAGVVGGALAAEGRRSVALVGDAAFAMHGFEVHTAVEYRLPIVWVVLNNGGHGMVHQGDTLMHGAPLGVSDFGARLDIAAAARSMGARGVRVSAPSELQSVLKEALQHDGPTVIDAIIDPNELAPTLVRRVQTLKRFLSLSRSTDRLPAVIGG